MYVCNALDEVSNTCMEWVIFENPSLLNELAVTKADMVLIGGSITGIFAFILAFVIVAKALKSL
jgi:hypothetical protein